MSESLYAPNSVRVWRGFRLPALSVDQFCNKLGTVFVPATVKMQIDAGLQSYIPSIPAGLDAKPDAAPDETAILFWESPQTYWNGFTMLAVRTYTMTHGGCYVTENNKSRADFPTFFAGKLAADQPVYLFEKQADWMHGFVNHIVGTRPAAQDPAAFLSAAAAALGKIQREIALDGAIACLGTDYLVYWELRSNTPGDPQPPTGIPILQGMLDWNHFFAPAPTYLPIGLWDAWSGMNVGCGSSFNMQFEHRSKR
jgi:hypothetical protein